MSEPNAGSTWQIAVLALLAGLLGGLVMLLASGAPRVPATLVKPHASIEAYCGWCGRECPYCRASHPARLGEVKK